MLTVVVAVALAIAPGGLLGFAVAPGRARWLVWSAAPALSLGLIAVGMSWLHVFGLPRGAVAVLVAEIVVAIGCVAAGWWRAGFTVTWWRLRKGAPGRADLIGAGVPAVVTAVTGIAFFGRFSQPPGWDAMYHGMLTREILQHGSSAVSAACRTGSVSSVQACHFSPLAADVMWAQSAQLSNGRIGLAMLAWESVIGPLALVVALYVLLRLLGARPVVAACAASCVDVIGPLWMSTATGRITQEVTPGLAVSVVVLAVVAWRADRGRVVAALAGVATAGVLLTHTYEVLFAGVFVVAVLVVRAAGAPVGRMVHALAVLLAVTVLAIGPALPELFAAGGERGVVHASTPGDVGAAFGFWVTDLQRYVLFGFPSPSVGHFGLSALSIRIGLWITIACLLAAPLCLLFGQLRWARPWLVVWAVFTAIGVWTASSNSAAALWVSGLWYGVPERLRSIVTPVYAVLVVAGACAIALCVRAALRRIRTARGFHGGDSVNAGRRTANALAVAAVGALVVLASLPNSWRPLARDLSARTPHGASYPRSFAWLADHLSARGVAAYDQNLDMVTWSYVDDEVGFLFGEPPVSGGTDAAALTDYAQRRQAWDWLVNNPGATPAGCLVSRFGIEYVVVGSVHVPNFVIHYDASAVAHSPRLDLVHQDGPINIYKVKATATVC